ATRAVAPPPRPRLRLHRDVDQRRRGQNGVAVQHEVAACGFAKRPDVVDLPDKWMVARALHGLAKPQASFTPPATRAARPGRRAPRWWRRLSSRGGDFRR